MLAQNLAAFIKAIYRDWVARMSGGASILLTVLATVLPTKVPHWVFWIAASLCLLVACFRAWSAEHEACEALEKRIAGFPNLVLEPNGFRMTRRIIVTDSSPRRPPGERTRHYASAFVASLTFVNDPKSPTDESVAKSVTASVAIHDADTGRHLSNCPGRWIPQYGDIYLSEEAAKTVDFSIGGRNMLGIAMKLPPDYECFPFDQNPCWHPDLPSQSLVGSEFRAVIRLRCPYFDRTWTVPFRDLGHKKGLKALPIQESWVVASFENLGLKTSRAISHQGQNEHHPNTKKTH